MRQRFRGRDCVLAEALIVSASAAARIDIEHGKRETLAQYETGDLASGNAQAKIACHVANEIEADRRSQSAHLSGNHSAPSDSDPYPSD
jgi:hypothetical protein